MSTESVSEQALGRPAVVLPLPRSQHGAPHHVEHGCAGCDQPHIDRHPLSLSIAAVRRRLLGPNACLGVESALSASCGMR